MAKITDKKRMDWLEENNVIVYGIGESDGDWTIMECEDGSGKDCKIKERTLREAIDIMLSDSKKKLKKTDRIITGVELRFAAENELPVYYEETYENPHDSHMNFNGICVMKPAEEGFYIGNSDIVPDDFTESQIVSDEFGEGSFSVYAVEGIKYG